MNGCPGNKGGGPRGSRLGRLLAAGSRGGCCVLLLMAMGASCRSKVSKDPVRSPRVVFRSASGKEVAFGVELAVTADQRARGLMYRRSLPPDRGMLFVFSTETVQVFWMKNTYIPLDMIHIDSALRVVGIVHRAVPHDERGRGVGRAARFVLEVPGGTAARQGLAVGSRVRLENVPGL